MADADERTARGRAAYASQFGLPEPEAIEVLEGIVGERMAAEAVQAAGGAWVDDELSLRDRSLVVVAALLAQGGVSDRLRPHVRWAVEHGVTPEQLEAALAEQEARLRGDLGELVNVAASFNVLLAECAHNEVLRAMIQSFVTLMVERGPRVYQLEGFGEWDIQEHRGLYEAVRDRDPERAARLMREHIEELARRYRAVGAM